MSSTSSRNFTLEEAREVLPEVIRLTDQYYGKVQPLKKELAGVQDRRTKRELGKDINALFTRWASEIHDLGAEVKGPWLVDFDSGDGIYYCWQYGEEELKYFHRYETGFSGRRPIEKLKGRDA